MARDPFKPTFGSLPALRGHFFELSFLLYFLSLLAIGCRNRMRLKSLTVFDKFMSWLIVGKSTNHARAPLVVPTKGEQRTQGSSWLWTAFWIHCSRFWCLSVVLDADARRHSGCDGVVHLMVRHGLSVVIPSEFLILS